jgi:hypothetical protein
MNNNQIFPINASNLSSDLEYICLRILCSRQLLPGERIERGNLFAMSRIVKSIGFAVRWLRRFKSKICHLQVVGLQATRELRCLGTLEGSFFSSAKGGGVNCPVL